MHSTRRRFFERCTAIAAIGTVTPAGNAGTVARREDDDLPIVPDGELDEEFWAGLRGQFTIPAEVAYFNTGTLGSSPRCVLNAVVEHMTHVERDIADWDYQADHENFLTGYHPEDWVRDRVARAIGAGRDEISLTQNATMGMNFLANGIDLAPGEEVILVERCHPGGRGGWQLKDQRFGAHVRWVDVPVPPTDPGQLIELFEAATTARTRVWAFPHLSSGTAIRFPVRELCARARRRGIVSVVDGAQTFGHLAIDVEELGCDAYFSSPHKWLLAPKGTGILYVRRALLEKLWPTLASGNYDNYKDGAFRLMQFGTGNLSLLHGLARALDFFERLGHARVERRILALADRLRAGLARIPGVTIKSPTHSGLCSGTTIWQIDAKTGLELQDELWNRARVRVRSMGIGGVRQCCHIYNLAADVDRTLEVAAEIA